MKNLLFIFCILIILTKTGNVLSNENIFNVNNIEIDDEFSSNKEKLNDNAFKEAFKKLMSRLLLKEDFDRVLKTNLNQIKKLVSYYQIMDNIDSEKNKKTLANIFFDKERMHKFFYEQNILYSDIINTEVIIFPLLKIDQRYFIYNKNYFYKNWTKENFGDLIAYDFPSESIESIEKINSYKENIYDLNISDFFKEHSESNVVFAIIEMEEKKVNIFLNCRIEGKRIKKTLSIIKKDKFDQNKFYDEIILKTHLIILDLIKLQNLIDVKTPSFLNVKIKINNKKSNLVELNSRLKKIGLIDNFYVQELNKDFVTVKIKYLGRISKIIDKLNRQNIILKMQKGEWKLQII